MFRILLGHLPLGKDMENGKGETGLRGGKVSLG